MAFTTSEDFILVSVAVDIYHQELKLYAGHSETFLAQSTRLKKLFFIFLFLEDNFFSLYSLYSSCCVKFLFSSACCNCHI